MSSWSYHHASIFTLFLEGFFPDSLILQTFLRLDASRFRSTSRQPTGFDLFPRKLSFFLFSCRFRCRSSSGAPRISPLRLATSTSKCSVGLLYSNFLMAIILRFPSDSRIEAIRKRRESKRHTGFREIYFSIQCKKYFILSGDLKNFRTSQIGYNAWFWANQRQKSVRILSQNSSKSERSVLFIYSFE